MNQTISNSPHYLIIAHGSRSEKWNGAIHEFVKQIQQVNEQNGPAFGNISCCYLEHAEPSIPAALQALSQSEQHVIAIPFFLAPGVHVQRDVPELVKEAGKMVRQDGEYIHVKIDRADVHLIPHFAEAELLAENAVHRLKQRTPGTDTGLVLVYYGSKRYPGIWNALMRDVESKIKQQLDTIQIRSVYAGDSVDFSPQPLVDAMNALEKSCSQLVILPMLIAVGVIQTEVVPKALEQANVQAQVISPQDSILPDAELAQRIWRHGVSYLSNSRYALHYDMPVFLIVR